MRIVFQEEQTPQLLSDAGEDYLEANDAVKAVAAAEVVAALQGAPHPQLPSQVQQILSTHPIAGSPDLTQLALDAVEWGRTGLELRELREVGDTSAWFAALDELESRLKS